MSDIYAPDLEKTSRELNRIAHEMRDWALRCERSSASWSECFRWLSEGKTFDAATAREFLQLTEQLSIDMGRMWAALDALIRGDAPPARVM